MHRALHGSEGLVSVLEQHGVPLDPGADQPLASPDTDMKYDHGWSEPVKQPAGTSFIINSSSSSITDVMVHLLVHPVSQ